ncbi:MAG: DUF459 domain-containing protein [Deltaproteobacteria bacterium]|nr:DUF459 domain-containing protein [Deltaproteobacteria bacterium]
MFESLKPRVSLDEATREKTPPRVGILSLWGVVVALSFYGAPTIREEVEKSPLAESPVRGVAAAIESVGNALGAGAARGLVDGIRQRVQAPLLVLVQPLGAPDLLPATTATAAVSGEVARHHISPKPKRRVLVIGASSIQFALGVELEHEVPKYPGAKVKRLGKLATSLARPDFFDWPATLETLARQFHPDLVIANFGGNCAQDIPVGSQMIEAGTPKWRKEYGARVKQMIDIAKKHGAESIYIGMPNMRDPAFAEKMKLVNSVQEEVARAEGATFVSTWAMTSEADGSYRETVQIGKKRGLLRTSDGVHFKPLGAKFIVDHVLAVAERTFSLGASDPTLARAEAHSFESPSLARSVEYVGYLPKKATSESKVPVAVIFHDGKWSDWPTHPHRMLQKTAEANGFAWVVVNGAAAPIAPVLASELMPDLTTALPVDGRRWLVAGPPGVEEAISRLAPAPVFEAVDPATDLTDVAVNVASRLPK